MRQWAVSVVHDGCKPKGCERRTWAWEDNYAVEVDAETRNLATGKVYSSPKFRGLEKRGLHPEIVDVEDWGEIK
jgi:hypothetical protein